MELKTFKKALNEFLVSNGFTKKGSYYYQYFDDLIIVIGLQKSNYGKRYYINIGYVIIPINNSPENPRDVDGDIRARFSIEYEGKTVDFFDLEKLLENDENKLKEYFAYNINQYIKPVYSIDKLKSLLQKKPVMLFQTNVAAKRFFGF